MVVRQLYTLGNYDDTKTYLRVICYVASYIDFNHFFNSFIYLVYAKYALWNVKDF